MSISKTVIAATGIFVAASVAPLTASSQAICGPCHQDSEIIVACLQKEFGEEVRSIAMNHRGSMVRIFVNDRTGSWTFLTSMASGQGCINAAGWHYETIVIEGPQS